MLHGWPYDIHSFVDVTPRLVSAGYRVIVPYLRGYGTTRFLSNDTFRNGQPAAVAMDAVELMNALKIERATIAGFDWGARSADIIAALWPERCKGLVSVSGYLIGGQAAGKTPLSPAAEYQWWYQFYFATERGRAGYDANRREFAKLIWQLASPKWKFDEAVFERSAAAFENPDHVDIVIHNYRWRMGIAEGEAKYRRSRAAPGGRAAHCGSNDHARRRRQWRAVSATGDLCEQVLRQVRAPDDHRRDRAQPAAGSARGVRAGHSRC